jgi:hypothetical protein
MMCNLWGLCKKIGSIALLNDIEEGKVYDVQSLGFV